MTDIWQWYEEHGLWKYLYLIFLYDIKRQDPQRWLIYDNVMKRMTFENTLYLFVFVIKRQDPPRLLLYNNDMKHMKCNRCEVGNLRRHLKTHSGEKSNKCNQCDFQTLPRVKSHKLSLLSVFKLLWILSKLGSSRPSVAGLLRWLRPLHPKGAQAARYRLKCAWGKSCFRTCEQIAYSLFLMLRLDITFITTR